MRFLLNQASFKVGDIKANQKKILQLVRKNQDCDLIICPELSLIGYPPEDLLELPAFIQEATQSASAMQKQVTSPALLFGGLSQKKDKLFNSAIAIHQKKIKAFHKSSLSTTDTFDEKRFLSEGDVEKKIWRYKNKNILILICEDLWKIHPSYFKKKIDFTICINASPYFPEQRGDRLDLAKKVVQKTKAPFIYLNQVGGQDEWIFDGCSFVLDKKGQTLMQLPAFEECTQVVDFNLGVSNKSHKLELSIIKQKKQACILGIQSFMSKHNIRKAHLGLSGGLDSALILALLEEAIGAKNIKAFFLKGPYSSDLSLKLSKKLTHLLNVPLEEIAISSVYEHALPLLGQLSPIAKQNIQSRLRLLFLMSYSNTHPSFLVATSNKSELAIGYSTIYGDLSGAFCPIGDLYKTEVRQMAADCYPSKVMSDILKREPSAELAPSQSDAQELPVDYKNLDPILKDLIEKRKIPRTALEKKIFSQILKSEFKRRQSPVVFKLSAKSFGRGRRYPISNSYIKS